MNPAREWDEQYVLSLPIGEFDWFEAKGRKALDLTLPGVRESDVLETLAKAISAFANSGGGVLVYGLSNPSTAAGQWRVDDGGVSTVVKGKSDTREWLETVIPNLVDFPLTRFNVYAVLPTDPSSQIHRDRALYLIDIPDSESAPHQSIQDHKYYARVGGRSRPIGHRLVADIMGRRQYPQIDLDFEIEITTEEYSTGDPRKPVKQTEYHLEVTARNVGRVYAQYVNAFIKLPYDLSFQSKFHKEQPIEEGGKIYCEYYKDNTIQDVLGIDLVGFEQKKRYGPARYDPILPGLSHTWRIKLTKDLPKQSREGLSIEWTTYADNAPPNSGECLVKNIEIIDRRKN